MMRVKFLSILLVTAWIAATADIIHRDDVNLDGATDVGDVNTVLGSLLDGTGDLARSDVNGDGLVDVGDVNAVLECILTGGHVEERTGYDFVWDYDQIPEVHLEVRVDDWNRLLLAYDADRLTKLYIPANLTFVQRGQVTRVDSIGLRIRGNGSRHRPEGKAGELHTAGSTTWHSVGWGVNLRKYVKDEAHTLRGIRKIWLRYGYNEPTHVREMYCYRLYEEFGVKCVPRITFCNVGIHVEGDEREANYGAFYIMEPIDDRFLKDRSDYFGGSDGYLWKCGKGEADLKFKFDEMFGWDDNGEMDERPYVLKTKTSQFKQAKRQMSAFINNLVTLGEAEFHDWIATVTDVPLLLKTYAIMVAIGNWDDYWNNSNNYYLYFNSTNQSNYKVFFIPYDLDNTLGCSRIVGNVVDTGRHDPMSWGQEHNLLIARLMHHSDYRELYKGYLKELVNTPGALMDPAASMTRVAEWMAFIKPLFPSDLDRDNKIYDGPNEMSNIKTYRLTYGTDKENYFKVRKHVIDSIP